MQGGFLINVQTGRAIQYRRRMATQKPVKVSVNVRRWTNPRLLSELSTKPDAVSQIHKTVRAVQLKNARQGHCGHCLVAFNDLRVALEQGVMSVRPQVQDNAVSFRIKVPKRDQTRFRAGEL